MSTALLTILCGNLVGFTLGLIGGGGSVLAVPLLLYVVGVPDAHVAIGSSAAAASVNAFVSLFGHGRAGNVKWPCAMTFAAAGIAGAAFGSSIGKRVDGPLLLILFALVMAAVALSMIRPGQKEGDPAVRINPARALRLGAIGFLTGGVAGFFGIGGGFLVVPGIMLGSGMPMIHAVGSSLFSVGAFGLSTAMNYALSGYVDWVLAAELLLGGMIGSWFGMRTAIRLAAKRRGLRQVFAGVVFLVAGYMLFRSFAS